jgi:hypothetical protein
LVSILENPALKGQNRWSLCIKIIIDFFFITFFYLINNNNNDFILFSLYVNKNCTIKEITYWTIKETTCLCIYWVKLW